MPRKGWAARQLKATEQHIASLPRWMKRESGLERERIYVGRLSSRGLLALPWPIVAIVAFNEKEATEKMLLYCQSAVGVTHQVKISLLSGLTDIEGHIAIARAVFVLMRAGVPVLDIVQDGKEERVALSTRHRIVEYGTDPRYSLNHF